jgi:hypothetical protein
MRIIIKKLDGQKEPFNVEEGDKVRYCSDTHTPHHCILSCNHALSYPLQRNVAFEWHHKQQQPFIHTIALFGGHSLLCCYRYLLVK